MKRRTRQKERITILGCHQDFPAWQMDLPCLLLWPRGSHHHVSLPEPLALLHCQLALCTSEETLMRKELAFLGSVLLNTLIFLEVMV